MPEQRPGRQSAVAKAVEFIMAKPDFPAISDCVQQVIALTADSRASIPKLTRLVLRDPSLTLKLLRAVNSAAYNRSGKQIFSITHAISLVGVDKMRDLAGSAVFFDQFPEQSPGMKELVLMSLLTANHAQEVAGEVRYPNTEEAYVCGMFRNLGELLVANYYPTQYAEILRAVQERNVPAPSACIQVLGFRYEDLGLEVARHWQLPEKVVMCMEPSTALSRPRDDKELLQTLTAFSHSLTAAMHRHGPDKTPPPMRRHLDEYRVRLGLTPDRLQAIADNALQRTNDTFAAMQVPLDDLRLARQTEHALEEMARRRAEEAAEAAALGLESATTETLQRLSDEIKTLLQGRTKPELNQVLLMVLEAIHRGVPCDRVVFALADPEAGRVVGRFGLGENVDELVDRFAFPLSREGGPVGLALLRGLDVVVEGGEAANTEVAKAMRVPWMGLLPVMVDRVLVGCLYFERSAPREPLTIRERTQLGVLRDQVIAAIRAGRT